MSITLRQLSYFLALADARSFGGAAEKVHISQPALSMQIRELEAALNVALVERLPRGLHLTREGRELETRARRILAEISELEAAARRKALTGRLNLGVIPTVAPYLLPRALPNLRADDLTRDLRIREARTDDLMADLHSGRLDAVVVADLAYGSDLSATSLFEDRFLLAGSERRISAASAGMEALRPATLDPDQLLLLDEGHCLADQALEVCGLDRKRLRLDLGAASLSTLCGLVGQGVGLTFLPEIAVATESAAVPGIALRRFAEPEPSRRIVLVRRVTSDGEGWFARLAEILAEAGAALMNAARRAGV
ncbi:LysR substrate-binding domain-containing protein [Defluviimonas sp. WL0050]|uniref:LysR substrate-binding domain-containing protein n=1 Tax=Albidovulum litorale TaxID=2984134 RepID=A0ABT2ZP41_9RHOB|nr:hydrogen peroxide-inducible genes activator [Defluviimonas sp. WL0050]MCV2872899.1 LysR substrate-binding domain-containing protein [Defluviimonas sp. WL0050]